MKRRIIWIDTLRRVCIDNTLFLPSFPIPDMSDIELEWVAMAPYRWVKLCNATFARRQHGSKAVLHPTKTRMLCRCDRKFGRNDWSVIFVPGGRYLITYSNTHISIWDLGYTSDSTCKLLASVEPGPAAVKSLVNCLVNQTSDGMGLIIAVMWVWKY